MEEDRESARWMVERYGVQAAVHVADMLEQRRSEGGDVEYWVRISAEVDRLLLEELGGKCH